MARSSGQKLKLLYIVKLLEEESCEDSPVSTQRVIEYLAERGIAAERKSIYSDMDQLKDYGYDILQISSRQGGGYYLGTRAFELAELKLLVDAVQSSRFITLKKSRELIAKLENMAGKHDASKLKRQVQVIGRVKTENERIYYNIDTIHRAIQENRQIAFQYMDWNLQKKLVPRDDKIRVVSPWTLIWQNENYYLAAYEADADKIKHYRVDKMGEVGVLEQAREGSEQYESLDLSEYTKQTFGMFGGQSESVTMSFPNHLVGVVVDRFGKDVPIRPMGKERFQVRAQVAVSNQFFGWLAGIGKEAKIVKPDEVRQKYQEHLKRILEQED